MYAYISYYHGIMNYMSEMLNFWNTIIWSFVGAVPSLPPVGLEDMLYYYKDLSE